jgi:hypothetical protein
VQSGDSLDFLCFRKAKTRGFNWYTGNTWFNFVK